MYQLEMLEKVRRYLRQFRGHWCERHLSKANGAKGIFDRTRALEDFKADVAYRLSSHLQAGWYMLEMQARFSSVRTEVCVGKEGRSAGDYGDEVRMTLHSGRMSKRLVLLKDGGRLRLDIRMKGGFELQHFRLVRVTQMFARSRMLRKLRALHPRYKNNFRKMQTNRRTGDSFADVALIALWNDYCALFDGFSEIVKYSAWVGQFDTMTDEARSAMHSRVSTFERKPLISIVMPVYRPNSAWLEQAIESVKQQIYPNWELCIADDSSCEPRISHMLENYALTDRRIKVMSREQNGHISAASNSALQLVEGEWVALLDHDDVLAEHALLHVVNAINNHSGIRMIYSDEDKIDEAGERKEPYFKCDWNPDLFYSQNMFSHLGVYDASLVREVGGFRVGFEGAQDYDLVLRCLERVVPEQIHHIPQVLYHWRIHTESTSLSLEAKPYSVIAGVRALNEHFERKGVDAKAQAVGQYYRVRYALPDHLPLVSLIIPTRNGLKLLRQCVESILKKTTYSNYEILIVDNGSDDPETRRYLNRLGSVSGIRVIRDDRPFNYSALNNAAVKSARGEILGLINNDIEVISPDWLSEMVSHALRPEVGAVGARLWYADDTIQHAGVVLGLEGFAGHVHRYLPRDDYGYCGRAALIQSFSAVTGACLVVRKSIYEAVGGLNEVELQVTCNDVDFCLRVREAGYRNIWTPYAELYHHESSSRGFDDTPEKTARSETEVAYMHQRWGDSLRNDQAYSPNLSLDNSDFGLAWPPRRTSVIPAIFETFAVEHR